jgi:hypothetical protein
MTTVPFDHDEPGYEQWKRHNPDGYVLNTHRSTGYEGGKIH